MRSWSRREVCEGRPCSPPSSVFLRVVCAIPGFLWHRGDTRLPQRTVERAARLTLHSLVDFDGTCRLRSAALLFLVSPTRDVSFRLSRTSQFESREAGSSNLSRVSDPVVRTGPSAGVVTALPPRTPLDGVARLQTNARNHCYRRSNGATLPSKRRDLRPSHEQVDISGFFSSTLLLLAALGQAEARNSWFRMGCVHSAGTEGEGS